MKSIIPSVVLMLSLLCLGLVSLAGCSSANTPVKAPFPEGSGFTISASAVQRIVPFGGATVLTAVVRNSAGDPIADNAMISMTSSQGGTFVSSSGVASPQMHQEPAADGVVTVGYQPPAQTDAPSRLDLVTFSYQGAMTTIELELVANSF